MKLHTRWQETRYGIFQRRTEFELYCRAELSEAEQRAYRATELGETIVCEYHSRGLQMDTRLSSLIAGETRFGSEDKAYLEDIERQVAATLDDMSARLRQLIAPDSTCS